MSMDVVLSNLSNVDYTLSMLSCILVKKSFRDALLLSVPEDLFAG